MATATARRAAPALPDPYTETLARLAVLEAAVASLAPLEPEVRRLARQVDMLLAGRGPREAGDVVLIHEIAEASEWLPFHASAIMERATYEPALEAALLDVDITSSRQLGKLFGRLENVDVEGVRLERRELKNGAYLWICVKVCGV